MDGISATLRRVVLRRGRQTITAPRTARPQREAPLVEGPPIDIAPNDPLVAYFAGVTGAIDLDSLQIESPGAEALRAAGVKMVVPLVSQGELIGLLNLGPRRSEQDYSSDDRKLLANLAGQAAPAVRVGQLVREQEAEARARERIDQELRVAQLIQQQFLPKELPELGGWHVAAYYRPAREVGGDFYDFIELPDGRIGIVAGDVTDKGVPAALVMASTHSILRGEAPRLLSPGKVLERANDLLFPEIPAAMFVTCLYGVLDPNTGSFEYANAGHNLPYVARPDGTAELRATGMPLGLMPEMSYEEKHATLAPGETILLHSDGLAEAHNADRGMFGFPRIKQVMHNRPGGSELIDALLDELDTFTGAGWEQEDDITLVVLRRSAAPPSLSSSRSHVDPADEPTADVLTKFTIPSEPGNERIAMQRVADAVEPLSLPSKRLEQLKTAVAEATMNAIEHGNANRPELPVAILVAADAQDIRIEVTDQGGDRAIPDPETPDLEAKLAGLQKARGWGLFLMEKMVDEMRIVSDADKHTIVLTIHRKGEPNGD
jgi:serine phosphatase RsbU (regulator of sigma subunit)/anti-sigma regulatory factor (Ser/Thr protein kinase)